MSLTRVSNDLICCLGFALVLHHTAELVLLPLFRFNCDGARPLEAPVLVGKKFTKIHIFIVILSVFLPGDGYSTGVKPCSMTQDWRRGILLQQRHLRRDWERERERERSREQEERDEWDERRGERDERRREREEERDDEGEEERDEREREREETEGERRGRDRDRDRERWERERGERRERERERERFYF